MTQPEPDPTRPINTPNLNKPRKIHNYLFLEVAKANLIQKICPTYSNPNSTQLDFFKS
jgi:hypothetical protein